MGKSSSSLKKKRSKARFKRRSKSRTEINKKSKKHRHYDDSVSYSSDGDDSRSLVSVSSSSSEDDYRRKRSRSRTRSDVKRSKKRARRLSSSHESIQDSPCVPRRKKSKKNDDIKIRKKSREKKKRKSKKDVSVSSTRSESWSCSTCRDGSSNRDESEVEKNRGRSERKDKSGRLEKVKNGRKRGISRSRSCSSCSRCSEYRECRHEDNSTGEANSRRLRSVIIVTREGTEEEGMDNEHEEEMVYDHGDYPSSRSNDSTEGGSKKELVHNSHASPKNWCAGDEKGEAVVVNIRTNNVTGSGQENAEKAGSNPSSDGTGINNNVEEKWNEDLGATGGMDSYDFETILRQKALENLRMFRCRNQTDKKVPVDQKDKIGGDAKMSPTIKSQSSQNRSPVGVGVEEVGPSQVAKGQSISVDLSQNDKGFNRIDNGKEIRSTTHNLAYPSDQLPHTGNSNEIATVTSESNQSRSVVLASKEESLSICSTKKQLCTLQEPPQAMSMIKNNQDTSMVETAQTANPLSSNSNFDKANNVSTLDDLSSCTKSSSAGTSSSKLQDEANGGSQFQQKTMTVMRGGEMVEVSYKVYIPKKAPALARRPLKR